jgi:aspartate-semialdehyde dehydrogenase
MDETPDEPDEEMSRGELLDFLGEFLSQHRDANTLYRDHLCAVLIARVYDEFGNEGLCNVMQQMDLKANWVSDIIFEASDFDNALFKRHGTYDDEIVEKARQTQAFVDLNKKIWRLRRRYANIIVDEVMANKKVAEQKEE